MLQRTLRSIALAASAVLLLSLGLFAIDQSGSASQQAQDLVNRSGAQALGPPVRAGAHHGAVRAAIDDAASALSRPFAGLAPGRSDSWGYELTATLLGLLLYGFGLGALARSVALARLKAPPPPHARFEGPF